MQARAVIPTSYVECRQLAAEEAEQNYMNYEKNDRKDEELKDNIKFGKYGELVFCFENANDITIPPTIGKTHNDGGVVDMEMKHIGKVQVKTSNSPNRAYVRYIHSTIDNALLVVGFANNRNMSTSNTQKIDFYCQAPSKLKWKKTDSGKLYLDSADMIKWTNALDVFKLVGKFPKSNIYPDNDLPEDIIEK